MREILLTIGVFALIIAAIVWIVGAVIKLAVIVGVIGLIVAAIGFFLDNGDKDDGTIDYNQRTYK